MLLSGERVEIPGYKARHVFGVILGVPLVLGCFLVLTHPAAGDEPPIKNVAIGLAGVLLFGAVLIMATLRLLRRGPMVILDERGITDFMWRKPRFMAWTEVQRVDANLMRTVFNKVSLVSVIPNDATRFIADWPDWRKNAAAKRADPYKMTITEANMDPYQLRDLILQFKDRYGSPGAPPVVTAYPRS